MSYSARHEGAHAAAAIILGAEVVEVTPWSCAFHAKGVTRQAVLLAPIVDREGRIDPERHHTDVTIAKEDGPIEDAVRLASWVTRQPRFAKLRDAVARHLRDGKTLSASEVQIIMKMEA